MVYYRHSRSGRGVPDLKRSGAHRHQDVSPKVEEEDKEIFSFKSHNMQYFDSQGVKERTGYGEPKDWYLMVIKELLDNAVDYLQKNYRGSKDALVTAIFTISKDGSKINYEVRNSNPHNKPFEAFEVKELEKILNYDMSYGSKQNDYRISRGFLGDATKQIIALPYVLMNRGDDGTAFFKKQWEIPMYFRANGIERQVLVRVNKGQVKQSIRLLNQPTSYRIQIQRLK